MANSELQRVVNDLVLRCAKLEADLEVLKCRQLITDFRVDALKIDHPLQQQQLQQQQQQQHQQHQQQDDQGGVVLLLEPAGAAAAAAAAAVPPAPAAGPAQPIGVVWPTEGQRRFELNRRREAVELAVARIRRPPTPPRPRLPEFADEERGLIPPIPPPRRNRLRGTCFVF